MGPEAAAAAVEAVFGLFDTYGASDYIGEPVSQLQHALQAADHARREGQPDQVVLAALLHDIGHMVGLGHSSQRMVTDDVILGVTNHERVGADFLRRWGFPEQVAYLVENHVQAKRYLTFKKKEYYQKLSPASRGTLVHQGGPMTAAEATQFEKTPAFHTILRMRTWDEAAKRAGVDGGPLQLYKNLCLNVLTNEAQGA